jgi:predicted metal-binding protein
MAHLNPSNGGTVREEEKPKREKHCRNYGHKRDCPPISHEEIKRRLPSFLHHNSTIN